MERYLSRVGYTGSAVPSPENLDRLIRCHLETVPFENLDFWHNPTELSLAPEDLYDKIVLRRRGGVCCELNTMFHRLLTELGYDARIIPARVTLMPEPCPVSHECILTELGGKRYYCDVGFGGPGPKGLLCLDEAEVQTVYGEQYRCSWEGFTCTVSRQMGEGWKPVLKLLDVPVNMADFEIMLYYFTHHPRSHFVNTRTVNLCLPDGYLALTNNVFSGLRDGESFRREVPESEIPALLREEFGLEVS